MRRTAMVLVGLLLFCWRLPHCNGAGRTFVILKAARTVAAGRQCGRMPAAGDRVGGVHREVAEAPEVSRRTKGGCRSLCARSLVQGVNRAIRISKNSLLQKKARASKKCMTATNKTVRQVKAVIHSVSKRCPVGAPPA